MKNVFTLSSRIHKQLINNYIFINILQQGIFERKNKTKQAYKDVTKGHALRHYNDKLVEYTKLLNVFFTTVVALKLFISSIFIHMCQTTTIFQLRTQHIPLNIHLMRNNKKKLIIYYVIINTNLLNMCCYIVL